MNKDLPDPNASDPLVWEYLWNDPLPVDVTKIPDDSQEQLREPDALGFVDNYREGRPRGGDSLPVTFMQSMSNVYASVVWDNHIFKMQDKIYGQVF